MSYFEKKSIPSIRHVIGRSFIFASFTILALSIISSIYFNHRNIQILHENNLKKTHEILTHILRPALAIADSTEIRQLLSLTSRENETFAAIDTSGNILLSDYNKLKLVKEIFDPLTLTNCENFHTIYRKIEGRQYWINCSSITSDDSSSPKTNLGILISFSHFPLFSFSSTTLYFLSITVVWLLLIIGWFQHVLRRRLLKPLVLLGNHIVNKAESPLSSIVITDIGKAPYEVHAIKNSFEKVLTDLRLEYQQRNKSEMKAALIDLTANVAHDVGSPLAVMEITLLSIVNDISTAQYAILAEAIQTMRNISSNLLSRYRESNSNDSIDHLNTPLPLLLSHLLKLTISQKQLEWKNNPCELTLKIDDSANLTWINANPEDIKRMLSNLLNNAYESLNQYRNIEVSLKQVDFHLELKIQDSGVGIPIDKINDALNGMSSKHAGKGLGLSMAKDYMDSINGKLTLSSTPNKGTVITLLFPCTAKPDWFTNALNLSKKSLVIVLDDDASIHNYWHSRLQECNISSQHFSSSDDLLEWHHKHHEFYADDIIYLVDYEIRGDKRNGLDVLEHFNAKERGYLVTGHAADPLIQQNCEKLGVWLIPKWIMREITIR